MKYRLFLVIISLFAPCSLPFLQAQTNLTGRIYYNENIMSNSFKDLLDDNWGDVMNEAIAKKEKEKGRKLTDDEKAEIQKKAPEARAKIDAIMKAAMSTAITVEFKSEKQAVMKMDMKVNDEALKQLGVSWIKRKAMKALMAVAPSTDKAKYVVKDNLVIFDPDDEPDTLRLSNDGKFLYGKFDKTTDFKLTRTK